MTLLPLQTSDFASEVCQEKVACLCSCDRAGVLPTEGPTGRQAWKDLCRTTSCHSHHGTSAAVSVVFDHAGRQWRSWELESLETNFFMYIRIWYIYMYQNYDKLWTTVCYDRSKRNCRCCFTLGACIHAKELGGKALQDNIEVCLKGKVFGHDFTICVFCCKDLTSRSWILSICARYPLLLIPFKMLMVDPWSRCNEFIHKFHIIYHNLEVIYRICSLPAVSDYPT